MIRAFADTSYFVALLSQKDRYHEKVHRLNQEIDFRIVTSNWVIVELANSFRHPRNRRDVADLIEALLLDSEVEVVSSEGTDMRQGLTLFRNRQDKSWSLTDCISFVIMREKGLTDALTSDHHFEQAGFVAHLIER